MAWMVTKIYDVYNMSSYSYYSTSLSGYINNCKHYWGWKYLKYLHLTKGGAKRHCNKLNKRLKG